MTALTDFSDDEVARLLDAPGAVQKAMVVADGKPGVGNFFKAASRSAKVFSAAQQDENELVRALALALRDRPKPAGGPGGSTDFAQPDPEAEAERAVVVVSGAVAVLRRRGDRTDHEAYAAWVLAVATGVAEATTLKEGGLFGRRVRISPNEQAVIERLTTALGPSAEAS